jgi:hypothetical protein
MNIRSLSILISIAASAVACGKSKSDFQVGAPDSNTPPSFFDAPPKVFLDAGLDAFEFKDAKVFLDAHIYEDAHVYNDAPIARSCTNVSNTLNNGQEILEVSVQCETPADAGPGAFIKVAGSGSASGEMQEFGFSLVCGTTYGHPANNFFTITTADVLLAKTISTANFDVTCD